MRMFRMVWVFAFFVFAVEELPLNQRCSFPPSTAVRDGGNSDMRAKRMGESRNARRSPAGLSQPLVLIFMPTPISRRNSPPQPVGGDLTPPLPSWSSPSFSLHYVHRFWDSTSRPCVPGSHFGVGYGLNVCVAWKSIRCSPNPHGMEFGRGVFGR